jgi:hypothetical protein
MEGRGNAVLLPAAATYYSLSQSVPTGTGSQPASYAVDIAGGFFLGKAEMGVNMTNHLSPVEEEIELYA